MAPQTLFDNDTPFEKLPTELSQQIFLESTELNLEEDPIWRDPYGIDTEKYEQKVDSLVKSVTSIAILLQTNQKVRGVMNWVLRCRINQIKKYLRFLGLRLRPVWKEVTAKDDLCRPELIGLPRYDFDYPTVRARYWQVYEPCFAGEPGEVQTAQAVVGFKRYDNRFPTSEPPYIGIHLVFIWRLYDTILEELILEDKYIRVCILKQKFIMDIDNQHRSPTMTSQFLIFGFGNSVCARPGMLS